MRLARFMAETCRTILGMRDNKTRIGPFEIYFPIADVPANIDSGNFRLLVSAAGYLSAQEFP